MSSQPGKLHPMIYEIERVHTWVGIWLEDGRKIDGGRASRGKTLPGERMPVLMARDDPHGDGRHPPSLGFHSAVWGWSGQGNGARALEIPIETASTDPRWFPAYQARRCLIPFDALQATLPDGGEYHCRFVGNFHWMGGLWTAEDDDGVLIEFAVLTAPTTGPTAFLGPRMPVVLGHYHREGWLESGAETAIEAREQDWKVSGPLKSPGQTLGKAG